MRVLVTGNLGYVGAATVERLRQRGHTITGLDTGFYEGCGFYPRAEADVQIRKDIRHAEASDFDAIDAVIHLAALSNDPLGDLDPALTYEINHLASVRLAELAKSRGVPRFVMVSTCSVYGVADDVVTETSPTGPLTAYADAKLRAEADIRELASDEFCPVFLRPATAFGTSAQLRLDLVLNNLTASAFTAGQIRIMSDGTPLRPGIHVRDLAATLVTCAEAPRDLVFNEIFNTGRNADNYSVREMADEVARTVPNCSVVYTGEHTDSRSYRVNFDKLAARLGKELDLSWDLQKGTRELYDAFRQHNLSASDIQAGRYSRLTKLRALIDSGQVDTALHWRS